MRIKLLIFFIFFSFIGFSSIIYLDKNLTYPYYIENKNNVSVICNNNSFIKGGSGFVIINSKNIKILNCNIRVLKYGFFISNSSNVTIKNNFIFRSYTSVYLRNVNNLLIINNTLNSKKYVLFFVGKGNNINISDNKFNCSLYQIKFGDSSNYFNISIFKNIELKSAYNFLLLLKNSSINNVLIMYNLIESKKPIILDSFSKIKNVVIKFNFFKSLHLLLDQNTKLDNVIFLNNYYDNISCIDKDQDGFCENKVSIFGNISDNLPISKYYSIKKKIKKINNSINNSNNSNIDDSIDQEFLCTFCNEDCCNFDIDFNFNPPKENKLNTEKTIQLKEPPQKNNEKTFFEKIIRKFIILILLFFISILIIIVLVLKLKIIYHLLYE